MSIRIHLFLAAGILAAQTAKPPVAIDMQWAAKIPMRDGAHLNATIYRPHDQKDPLPVIFTFTPYIGDSYVDRASYFSRNGYVYALIDVRGRGNSEGSFEPFLNEGRDGYDVVEWLAKQPWSNGTVAMWGGSYAGFDQWTVAKEFPPHLTTIVPAASAYPGVDFPLTNNVHSTYLMQWLTFVSGVTGNEKTFGDGEFWNAKFAEFYSKQTAYQDFDKLVGNPSANFQKWIAHPTPDEYFDAMTPKKEDYARLSIPILTITGDYDGDQVGAMTYYRHHMQYGSVAAKANHYLIVGPWDHPGTRTPKKEVGGLKFGDASVLDLNALHKAWYDWTMKSGPKPEFLKDRVAYFVPGAGAEDWRYAPTLETLAKRQKKLYLTSTGEAGDVFHSGHLAETAQDTKPDHFIYDPLDTRTLDLQKRDLDAPFLDQAGALILNGNGVVYHTDPIAEPLEITGYVRMQVWLSMDVKDTDFEADLFEIRSDGSSVFLASDLRRARYRESLRKEKLVTPGEVNQYTFDFPFFARHLEKGSRLRLVLSCENSMGVEKNYNSGGLVAAETAKDAHTAHVTVHHDTAHESYLELPVH